MSGNAGAICQSAQPLDAIIAELRAVIALDSSTTPSKGKVGLSCSISMSDAGPNCHLWSPALLVPTFVLSCLHHLHLYLPLSRLFARHLCVPSHATFVSPPVPLLCPLPCHLFMSSRCPVRRAR